jgi:ankyrin repeat protein
MYILPLFTITMLRRVVTSMSRNMQVRYYASDADLLNKIRQHKPISRVSQPEPKANDFIRAIRSKDYKRAELMVKQQNVDVDGHTTNENTALTDCADRGDVEGTRFLLTKLAANPYASCDCPYHKTALHYASENGHLAVLEELVKHVKTLNVPDNRGYTPLDIAKTPEVKAFLSGIHNSTKNYPLNIESLPFSSGKLLK